MIKAYFGSVVFMGDPVCYNCKGTLTESGLGVKCPYCGSMSFVAPDGRAVAHLVHPLAPLDPGGLLAEKLARMGIPCTIEKNEPLWAPCYLFTPAEDKPLWRVAYADVAGRFYANLPPPQRKLVPYYAPPEPYRLVEPSITPAQAESHLLQRGLESPRKYDTALVHMPIHRLHYAAGGRRGVALAVAERVYMETPARPTETGLGRLRLYYGVGTAALVLLSTVAVGGVPGAVTAFALGIAGTVLLARATRSG
ncbi:MAG: hypothetical protein NTW26_02940 [bacterium]|nr:hypothetical protein [bacterium]